jgi:hypothetical protein
MHPSPRKSKDHSAPPRAPAQIPIALNNGAPAPIFPLKETGNSTLIRP